MHRLITALRTARAEVETGRADAVSSVPDSGLFAISSGPAAASAGAPRVAEVFVETLARHAERLVRSVEAVASNPAAWVTTRSLLGEVFEAASAAVRSAVPPSAAPSTSATVLVIRRDRAVVAHVGNTRAYLVQAPNIVRLTHDHATNSPEAGTLLAVRQSPAGSAGQSIGQSAPLKLDAVTFRLDPHATIVLVSEGVASHLPGRAILAALSAATPPAGLPSLPASSRLPLLSTAADSIVRQAAAHQVFADSTALLVHAFPAS